MTWKLGFLSKAMAAPKGQLLPPRAPAWQHQSESVSVGAAEPQPTGKLSTRGLTFDLLSIVGTFAHISFPIVHGDPILCSLSGQCRASLVQFIEYLRSRGQSSEPSMSRTLRGVCLGAPASAQAASRGRGGTPTRHWLCCWHTDKMCALCPPL